MDTNLLIQYLSGIGAAKSQAPWAQAANEITQQQLGAKSQFNLLDVFKKMLSGEMGESTAKIDSKGLGIKLAPSILKGAFGGESESGTMGAPDQGSPVLNNAGYQLGQLPPAATGAAPSMPNLPEQAQGGWLQRLLNPQVSQPGGVPSLAGLSATDVSNALSGALNIEQLSQAKLMQPHDIAYKQALTQEARARAERMNLPEDTRTAAIKNYEYAVEGGYTGSFDEFSNPTADETVNIKEWQQAVAGGYGGSFYDWKKEMTALGGGLSLGEKIAEKKAFADLAPEMYVRSPQFNKDLSKYMGSDEVQERLYQASTSSRAEDKVTRRAENEAALRKATMAEKVKFIENSFGPKAKIKSVRWAEDGRTMIWTVVWPSGETEEIEYAIRD